MQPHSQHMLHISNEETGGWDILLFLSNWLIDDSAKVKVNSQNDRLAEKRYRSNLNICFDRQSPTLLIHSEILTLLKIFSVPILLVLAYPKNIQSTSSSRK